MLLHLYYIQNRELIQKVDEEKAPNLKLEFIFRASLMIVYLL